MTPEETENLNRPICAKEIEFVRKNKTKTKHLGHRENSRITVTIKHVNSIKLYHTCKQELSPILLKDFQKIEEKTLPNTFHKLNIYTRQGHKPVVQCTL